MGSVGLADHVRANGIPAGAQERLANHVPQLTNIARPRLMLEQLYRLRGYDRAGRAQFRSVLLQKLRRQLRNIRGPLAQSRQMNERHIQPEVKVLTELAFLNGDLEVAMRG